MQCHAHKYRLMIEHLLELIHVTLWHCMKPDLITTAGRGRKRKRLPTENLMVPAALSLTSATFSIPSVCLHLLLISVLYFSLPPPLSPFFSTLSTSEFTTKACLLTAPPLFLLPCSSTSASFSSWPHFRFIVSVAPSQYQIPFFCTWSKPFCPSLCSLFQNFKLAESCEGKA